MGLSSVLKVVGGTDTSPSSSPPVDWITKTGMSILLLGIAVSMTMLFIPATTNHAADYLVHNLLGITGPSIPQTELAVCAALGIKATTLSAAGLIAQTLWLVGAVVLCIQPLRTKSHVFLVFELSMVLASLLPLLDISFGSTVILRACFTGIVMIWLGTLEGMEICKAMLPWYWGNVWQRKMGDTALAVVGSEILCWGYALFGVNAALAWVALIAGSVVMMRFGWSAARSGIRIAIAWYYLNMVYVVAGAIQLLWLLKTT